jgi:Ni,Fe-hydrogenase III large subunit
MTNTMDMLTGGFSTLPGRLRVRHGEVGPVQWRQYAGAARAGGGRLLSLWASESGPEPGGICVQAAYAMGSPDAGELIVLHLPLAAGESLPDISDHFAPAARMQRAAHDLTGVDIAGHRDSRPWLRHGAWAETAYPLHREFDVGRDGTTQADCYAFVPVTGEGVHEIPVGPVHAGIIEPGHFRFHVVGERVLRLEERLGYVHKGIEKRFEAMSLPDGARLAGRVSGDSTAAYAWAYAMAVENVSGTEVPTRGLWLRALLLERERIANHLGDLGYLGNDAGFAFGLSQFSRLKEDVLRLNAALFGHRYLMDVVTPGGVTRDVDAAAIAQLRVQNSVVAKEVADLRRIYDEHPGVQDRFIRTGIVTPELADRLGLCGLAGRASGIALDARVQFAHAPYDLLAVRPAFHRGGDVAARVHVRFDEVAESLRLIDAVLDGLPAGDHCVALAPAAEGGSGIGLVEGWRGEILVALQVGPNGTIRRLHPHDPSWQNWPVLEHAVIGNIVPDFPLINKSFNLSYSGHDL